MLTQLRMLSKLRPRRFLSTSRLQISYPSSFRPVVIFTAGAPGSGKTYCLHSIYGLENVTMIDLDSEMKFHPNYVDRGNNSHLYEAKASYKWADEMVEKSFQKILAKPPTTVGSGALTCLDGTGTHSERQKRRMLDAKRAGFWVVNLFVKVDLETALERNAKRERRVPEDILRTYVEELDDAVKAVTKVPGLVDEFIVFNNNADDGVRGRERWGASYDDVWSSSVERSKIVKFERRR